MIAKASMRHRKGAAQKARLVADMIRGKRVEEALSILRFSRKYAARDIARLLNSAVANAEQNPELRDVDNLYISRITVDGGPMMKRIQPRAMGRAFRILKRSSHINLQLDEKREVDA
jgi:large subunit ribosomal protein L22